MSPQPVKSAFQPMRPRIDEALAQKLATAPPAGNAAATKAVKQTPTQPEKKETPPLRPPEPLPRAVEIWLKIENRSDRSVFGWCFSDDRPPARKAIVVVLNRTHWQSDKAVSDTEPRLLPFLCGLLLADYLVKWRKRIPWLGPACEALRTRVFPEAQVAQCIFSRELFGQHLAEDPSFTRLFAEVQAPGGAEPGRMHKILTLEVVAVTESQKGK